MMLLFKGRKAVPIGTRVMIPGGKYYREKTATGWKHVKVERKQKAPEETPNKKGDKNDDEEEAVQRATDGANDRGSDTRNDADEAAKKGDEAKAPETPKKRGRPKGSKLARDIFKREDITIEQVADSYLDYGTYEIKGRTESYAYAQEYDNKYEWRNGLPTFIMDVMRDAGFDSLEDIKQAYLKSETFDDPVTQKINKIVDEHNTAARKQYLKVAIEARDSGSGVTKEYADIVVRQESWERFNAMIGNLGMLKYLKTNLTQATQKMQSFMATDRLYVTLASEDGYSQLFNFVVPFSKLQSLADTYLKGTARQRFIKSVKMSSGYKKYETERDAKLSSIVKEFKDEVGLEVKFSNTFNAWKTDPNKRAERGTAKNKPALVDKKTQREFYKDVIDIMKNVNKFVDMKKYNPPDGRKLSLTLELNQGANVAGSYDETQTTINISPLHKGAITHEMGHYFWDRSKEMQAEFMQWVKDSGLEEKLKTNTYEVREEPEKWHRVIDEYFEGASKKVLEEFALADLLKREGYNEERVKTFKGSMSALIAVCRKMTHDGTSYYKHVGYDPMSHNSAGQSPDNSIVSEIQRIFNEIDNYTDYELTTFASVHYSKNADIKAMYADSTDFYAAMREARDGFSKLNRYARSSIGALIADAAKEGLYGSTSKASDLFRDGRGYWKRPTEIFARTFRNYIALKGMGSIEYKEKYDLKGRLISDPSVQGTKEDMEADHVTARKMMNTYGWGFEEVDPDEKMLEFDDNRLARIYKKYIGEEVMKSLIRMVVKLEKSKLSEELKGKGKYKGGKKTWTQAQEDMGIKVEMEHTDDRDVAREIAMDHLSEDANYYTKLAKMESGKCS